MIWFLLHAYPVPMRWKFQLWDDFQWQFRYITRYRRAGVCAGLWWFDKPKIWKGRK